MDNRWENLISEELKAKYDFFNYNHALEILVASYPTEFNELMTALRELTITCEDILADGGNETIVPKKFAASLEPLNWKEIKISGDLVVNIYPRKGNKRGVFAKTAAEQVTVRDYIGGNNIDYVKGRVAVDMEWNSKDQTFDRDIFAFRTYYECGLISVAAIVTRSEKLNPLFKKLGVYGKYGASTTWIGKLLPRLDSRRHGGCPVLAIAIKPNIVRNANEFFENHEAANEEVEEQYDNDNADDA